MIAKNKVLSIVYKATKLGATLLIALGLFFTLAIAFAFTDLPFWAFYKLGTRNAEINITPAYIIQMSGSGFPSPDALQKSYYTALASEKYPLATIIIAIPANIDDSICLRAFKNELALRKVGVDRIVFETTGINTYTQVKNIGQNIISDKNSGIMIITSPEHVYRTVGTFRKSGFTNVGSMAAFEQNLENQNLLAEEYTEVSQQNLDLRYNFWNYLKLEITVAREYCAILYYKLKGWL